MDSRKWLLRASIGLLAGTFAIPVSACHHHSTDSSADAPSGYPAMMPADGSHSAEVAPAAPQEDAETEERMRKRMDRDRKEQLRRQRQSHAQQSNQQPDE